MPDTEMAHRGEESQAAPLLRIVLAQTLMELRLTLRRGESLLITLIVPGLLLIFFGSLSVVPVGVDQPIEFLLPGILALAVMSTGMVSLGIATAFERQYGVLKRLGASPLSRAGLLAAKLLAILLLIALQVALLLAIAGLVLGWRPAGSLVLAFPILLLGAATFASLGLLMAGALRAEATLAAANGLYLVLLLLGDMVVPIALLPDWVAAVARLLPAAAFAAALRSALQAPGTLAAGPVVVLLVWLLVAGALAVRTFRWE